MKKIRVYVIDKGRRFYTLKWTDPETGKIKVMSSKCKSRDAAAKKARDKEIELNSGVYQGDGEKDWKQLIADYSHQELSGDDQATEKWHTAKLNVFEQHMMPSTIGDVTTSCLSRYVAKLRTLKRSEDTIRGHIIALNRLLKWCKAQGLIALMPLTPDVKKKRNTKTKVKGRALEFWEFVRMMRAVKDVVLPHQVDSWRHLLIGLWLSGLRLAEAVSLSWNDPDAPRIQLGGEYPLLEIPAEHDKGREYRLMPITPDFARFILRTPESDRTGHVFRPLGEKGGEIENETNVSRTISSFGEKAKIIVDRKRIKYASAHDLRRTFGTRWSKKVMPIELKDLMRHAQISTTMTYYVGSEAQQVAARLWSTSNKVPLLVPPDDSKPSNTTK